MRNQSLIVAAITVGLAFGANAPAQQQDQSVPDAPQPQKKPAAKPQSSSSPSSSSSSSPAPPAKDDNAFPEDVSRAAATKAASEPDANKPTAKDNPFPESVSRAAAKAAGNDQAPPATPTAKPNLPPGVSSSQSGGSPGDADDELGSPKQVTDPALAKKDTTVGDFYLKQGNYQGALLRYRDAIASDPANVEAIFGLAETQRLLKKNADAARNYQLYLDIVPNGPKARQALKTLKTLQAEK